MELSARILKGPIVSIADQGLTSASSFFLTVYLARHLTEDDFGRYSLLFFVFMNINGLTNALISQPVRALGVREDATAITVSNYITSQLILSVAFGIMTSMCVIAVLPSFSSLSNFATVSFGLAILFTQIQEVVRALNASRLRWGSVLLSDVVNHAVRWLCLLLAPIWLVVDIKNAFLAIAAGAAFGATLHTHAGSKLNAPPWEHLVQCLKQNYCFGQWLILESLVVIFSTQAYVYLLAHMLDATAAGAFNAAQTLVNSVNVLWMGVTSFALPMARHWLIADGAKAWRRLIVTGSLVTGASAILIAVISYWAKPILALLFSPDFAVYSDIVVLLGLASILTVVNSFFAIAFRAVNLPQVGFYAKIVSAFAFLGVAHPLIKSIGIAGAAVGLLITQVLWLFVYFVSIIHLRRVISFRAAAMNQNYDFDVSTD